MEKILIIGGAGTVGRFIADLLVGAGHRPIIIDRVAGDRALDQRVMDALLLPVHAPELLQAADTLVVALPEDAARQVLERYAGGMPSLRLLVNTCSVQQPFQRQAARLFPGVPLLGINPMFSPALECRGRPVALCERGQSEAALPSTSTPSQIPMMIVPCAACARTKASRAGSALSCTAGTIR